jgi:hypothetical protein
MCFEAVKEEHSLGVFEEGVLRKMFGCNKEEGVLWKMFGCNKEEGVLWKMFGCNKEEGVLWKMFGCNKEEGVLRKMFGRNKEEVIRGWGKLHKDEVHNFNPRHEIRVLSNIRQ